MKKYILLAFLGFIYITSFAQDQKTAAKSQYLFIIRFKSNFVAASDTAVQVNIKHWQAYMGNLAQAGKIAGGYRPSGEGETISGTQKTTQIGPYIANNELVSSILVINADNMAEAKAIAEKCPVLELGGSVEIRPMMETAGK
jgi:hypothetical protein